MLPLPTVPPGCSGHGMCSYILYIHNAIHTPPLTTTPQVHIVCSLAAFTPPALSSLIRINSTWNISLQWLYPGVQIGLVSALTHCTGVRTGRYYQHYLQMGSLYGTIALSVERYCTVMYPFKYYRLDTNVRLINNKLFHVFYIYIS